MNLKRRSLVTMFFVGPLLVAMAGAARADEPLWCHTYRSDCSTVGCPDEPGLFSCDLFTSQDIKDLKAAISQVKEIAGVLSNISSYAAAAVQVGQFLGILDSPSDPYAAIYAHLDQLGLQIVDITVRQNINDYLAADFAAITDLKEKLDHGEPIVRDENLDTNTLTAVRVGMMPTTFERYRADSATEHLPDNMWKNWISTRAPADEHGFDYDWRVGMPALIDFINMRLQVMTAIASTTDHSVVRADADYRAEAATYRDALLAQERKMLSGIQCRMDHPDMNSALQAMWDATNVGVSCYTAIVCADINTGMTAKAMNNDCAPADYDPSCYWGCDGSDPTCGDACAQNDAASFDNYYTGVLNPLQDSMRNAIIQQMGIAEIDALIGHLDTLATPLPPEDPAAWSILRRRPFNTSGAGP